MSTTIDNNHHLFSSRTMAPKFLFALLAAAVGISSVSAAALPEAAPVPAPFVIPDDVEILDLRTEEDKKTPLVSLQAAII